MRKQFYHWLDKTLSAKARQYPVLTRDNYHTHQDISLYPYGKPETLLYNEPLHFGDLLPEYTSTLGQVGFPVPFVLEIRNGKIHGHHALVTTSDSHVLAESIFNHLPYLQTISAGRIHYPQSFSQFWQQLTRQHHFETVFVVANLFDNGYYHWLIETLPRLYLYQQHQQATGQEVPILFSAPLPEFAQTMLDMMGIHNYLLWDATFAQANNLLLPMAIYGTGIPSAHIVRWVSEQLSSAIDDLPKMDMPRIYLSRQNMTKRQVVNEDELLSQLKQFDFHRVQIESLSIPQQIALFKQAEVIIGPHGAGFANTIHCNYVKLIEFFEPSYINLCFYRLASALDFDYGYLVGKSHGLNMSVEPTQVERMLTQMNIPGLHKDDTSNRR